MTKSQYSLSRKNKRKTRELLNVPKGYVLHHKDPNMQYVDIERYIQWNPEDLEIMSQSDHAKLHKLGKEPWNKGKTNCYSEETLKKMSEAQKGKIMTDEQKKKCSESHKGLVKSEEHRKHLSEALKGNQNGKGHIHTEEARKKMSENRKGILVSEEAKEKMRQAKLGKHWKLVGGKRIWQ